MKYFLIAIILLQTINLNAVEFSFNVRDLREKEYIEAGPIKLFYYSGANDFDGLTNVNKDIISVEFNGNVIDGLTDTVKIKMIDDLISKYSNKKELTESDQEDILRDLQIFNEIIKYISIE